MGIRIEKYITCDQCGKEKLTTDNHLPNKKSIKHAARMLGFVVTTKHEFCSNECKKVFNLN